VRSALPTAAVLAAALAVVGCGNEAREIQATAEPPPQVATVASATPSAEPPPIEPSTKPGAILPTDEPVALGGAPASTEPKPKHVVPKKPPTSTGWSATGLPPKHSTAPSAMPPKTAGKPMVVHAKGHDPLAD
jgi:hypothetical protein